MTVIDSLLARYTPISEQVSREDIRIILEHLERALEADVPGDIVEFGCYIGTTSLFIERLLEARTKARQSGRAFHVYDSFEGLPPKRQEDTSPAGLDFTAGKLAVSKKQFINEFHKANLRLPQVHKGWFNQLTASDVPEQIAFAFLDGDFYESITSSLKLVLPRLSTGGTIIIHDYARPALPGVAKAIAALGLQPTTVRGLGIIS